MSHKCDQLGFFIILSTKNYDWTKVKLKSNNNRKELLSFYEYGTKHICRFLHKRSMETKGELKLLFIHEWYIFVKKTF